MKGFNNINRELNNIIKKAKALNINNVGNINFDYLEQELIRRIVKSVFPQLKNAKDKETAKSILGKTRWIDG